MLITPSMPSKVVDVLIIGGGPAGLAVASAIVRQLQTAILFDSGAYRNARVEHMYGVPGFDHADPEAFRTKAKGDILRRYDTVEFKRAYIEEVRRLEGGNFQVTDGWNHVYEGRKVVLATGVRDILPQIEGYDWCWGSGIYHSLFCHGYEERGGESVGLFAFDTPSGPDDISHEGSLALQLSRGLRVYTNGDEESAAKIQAAAWRPDLKPRVTIERRRIRSVRAVSHNASDVLVTLEDGTQIRESFITHHPPTELNGPFAEQLGLEKGPGGEIKVSPPFNETSVHGVFAAGDAATQTPVIPNAIYGGSLVGSGLISQLQAEKH